MHVSEMDSEQLKDLYFEYVKEQDANNFDLRRAIFGHAFSPEGDGTSPESEATFAVGKRTGRPQ